MRQNSLFARLTAIALLAGCCLLHGALPSRAEGGRAGRYAFLASGVGQPAAAGGFEELAVGRRGYRYTHHQGEGSLELRLLQQPTTGAERDGPSAKAPREGGRKIKRLLARMEPTSVYL